MSGFSVHFEPRPRSKTLELATQKMQLLANELNIEKEKTNSLLSELLPPTVADALKHGRAPNWDIIMASGHAVSAREYQICTIVFTDIVSFTTISSNCTPHEVVQLLSELYLRFDRLVTINQLYKVETVGDAYMAVSGVPDDAPRHVELILNMAIGMQWEVRQVMKPDKSEPLRVGG